MTTSRRRFLGLLAAAPVAAKLPPATKPELLPAPLVPVTEGLPWTQLVGPARVSSMVCSTQSVHHIIANRPRSAP